MSYVDGFVLAVPTAEKENYRSLADSMAPIFRKHGATEVVECWGEDVPEGKLTSFPMAVQCKDDETVVLAWIIWPDKATRDRGNKAAMSEMEAQGMSPEDHPFDAQRMIFAGFEEIIRR